MYTAVVVGATGLVGRYLMEELLNDDSCKEIIILVRKKTTYSHTKVTERIINFDNEADYFKYIKGDILFSCMGTTLAQAGSRENQFVVDYTYQYNAAEAAAKNNVRSYVLVSSPWADPESSNYYRRMKAELEIDSAKLDFDKIVFIKPNGLVGKRTKTRWGEGIALKIFTFLSQHITALNKHEPIEAKLVAKAMLNGYYKKMSKKLNSYARREVFELAKIKV